MNNNIKEDFLSNNESIKPIDATEGMSMAFLSRETRVQEHREKK